MSLFLLKNKKKQEPLWGNPINVNGTFEGGSWNLTTGITESGGMLNFDGTTPNYASTYSKASIPAGWYKFSFDIVSRTSGSIKFSNASYYTHKKSSVGKSEATGKCGGAGLQVTGVPLVASIDNVVMKPAVMSSLFSDIKRKSGNDITVSVPVTRYPDNKYQGGIAINIDNPNNPRNFVTAYLVSNSGPTGYGAVLEKCVNGVYTTLFNQVGFSYVAGASISIEKVGTTYTVRYNGTVVNSPQTISDASIIDNPYHSKFLTHKDIKFGNLSVSEGGAI